MIRRRALGQALAVLAAAAFLLVGTAGAEAVSGGGSVSLTVDPTYVSTKLGRKFAFRSTIANPGATATTGSIAHLNVVSLRDGVYVDPEDWSSQRTRYLGPIGPGESRTISWQLQAVNAGAFAVYVVVLPNRGVAGAPTVGPAVRVAVAERRTLDSGGILPLALGIPALLGLLGVGLRLRRRS